jgi:hypothetical protein
LVLSIALFALAFAARPSYAIWPTDPNINVPLCTATRAQRIPRAVPDGAGGAIVAWDDYRNSSNDDIYARRVDSSGNQLWALDGIAVCATGAYQDFPDAASDGAGGAYIVWQDDRLAANGWDIYAQHVLGSGALDPAWPPDGLPICVLPANQTNAIVIADGAGGAIVAWQDERGNVDLSPDIYAQRISATGAILWAANGKPATMAPGQQSAYVMISDGAGGAIVAWEDRRTGQYDIAAQRLHGATGNELWLHNGQPICTAAGDQNAPVITTDGAGGAIIAWRDFRGLDTDIYAQRVNPGGITLWAGNGVPVCTAPNHQFQVAIVSDGLGGAIAAWGDQRNNPVSGDIFAQRLNSGGVPQWTLNGVGLCLEPSSQITPCIISDTKNGAIVAWPDGRGGVGNTDIYARRVSASGTVLWTADGVAITTAPDTQTYPTMIEDGLGGAVLAWQDRRDFGTKEEDIYTQQIGAGGKLGVPGGPEPGTPLGPGFTIRIRENFVYPPAHAGGNEGPIVVGLPSQVEPGFVVLLDDSTGAAPPSDQWSDILWFPPSDPAGGGQQARFFSGPVEHPFTDADLAPYGLSIAQVQTGNTRYVKEKLPFVTWVALDTTTALLATYYIYSDVDTLPPGAPLTAAGAGTQIHLQEPPDESGEVVTLQMPHLVHPGFVVLLDDTTGSAEDSTKWSDVLYFTSPASGGPGQLILISDRPIVGAPEHGITGDDLAPFGFTVLDVIEGNTWYVPERSPTTYPGTNPAFGTTTYVIDEVPETGVLRPGPGAALAIRAVVPNPSSGRTRIEFEIPRAGAARLEVFDLAGARVRTLLDGPVEPGLRSVTWDGRAAGGRSVSAGVYFARLSFAGQTVTRRVLIGR